jgi:hypothetical protein
MGEAGIPAGEVSGQVVVEDSGADLQEQMGALRGPAHLLLFDHALGHHLVDGGLDEGGGDGLTAAAALAVVGDPLGVGADVSGELGQVFGKFALFRARVLGVEVDL